jgi:signal transduction histidine kinase
VLKDERIAEFIAALPRDPAVERFVEIYVAARRDAEEAEERTHRLQAVTNGLASALDPSQVASVILGEGLRAMGAAGGGVAVIRDGTLNALQTLGYEAAASARYFVGLPLDTNVPIAWACKHKEPVLLENAAQWAARFPINPAVTAGHKAWVVLPLMLDGVCIGGLGASFAEEKQFSARDREFLLGLASQCAQALHRAQLFAAERTARAAAEEAVRMREEFLGIASHELRTPLTPLMLQLAILRKAVEGTALTPRVEMAQRQTERLARLVTNLLDVARIGSGKLEMELEDVDLEALVQGVVDRMKEEARKQGCTLVVHAARVNGRFDPMRIEQLLANLLSNAIKYGAGHPIEVRLSRQGETARLEVSDGGIGIAPESQDRIFQRFERAVSMRQFGGLGLGLYISRQIVEAHGGSIQVVSEPGKGSTFMIALPLQA